MSHPRESTTRNSPRPSSPSSRNGRPAPSQCSGSSSPSIRDSRTASRRCPTARSIVSSSSTAYHRRRGTRFFPKTGVCPSTASRPRDPSTSSRVMPATVFGSTRRTGRGRPTSSSGSTTTRARSSPAGTTSTRSFPAWRIPSSGWFCAGASLSRCIWIMELCISPSSSPGFSSQLETAKLHHKPYQAYCKGKVEAVNKTIKNDFQGEAQRAGFQTLEELNSAFMAWVDLEYNVRVHSTTGEAPDKRFAEALHADIHRVSDIAWFEALFLMRVNRTVTKYGKIKLESNEYPVTSAPYGTVVQARYDPFDLSKVFIFKNKACVETTSVSKLVQRSATALPEESKASGSEVSSHAQAYFQALREQHLKLLTENPTPVSYSKLSRKDVP